MDDFDINADDFTEELRVERVRGDHIPSPREEGREKIIEKAWRWAAVGAADLVLTLALGLGKRVMSPVSDAQGASPALIGSLEIQFIRKLSASASISRLTVVMRSINSTTWRPLLKSFGSEVIFP